MALQTSPKGEGKSLAWRCIHCSRVFVFQTLVNQPLSCASCAAGACVRTTVGAVTNLQETNAGQGGRPTAQ